MLGGDDVDHTSQSIRTEAYGHHSLVDLNTFGVVHGEVIQVQCLPCPFLWHTVDEDLDMTAAEAVQHQLHVRTHAATLAQLHAGRLGQGIAQGLGGVVQFGGIHRHGIIGRTLHTSHPGGCDHYFVQLPVLGAEGKIQYPVCASLQVDFLLHRLITHGRHHQGILPFGSTKAVAAFRVHVCAVRGAFQIDAGKVDDFALGRGDAPAQFDAVCMMVPATMLGPSHGDGKEYQQKRQDCLCIHTYSQCIH